VRTASGQSMWISSASSVISIVRSQCTAINAGCGYGVLRLMAAVIHSLREKGDRNPLILPSTIPMDDARVHFELTRYLPDNWVAIIEKNVDGPSSLPLKIDREVPNLGKLHATRRVARTIFLGSAATAAAAHRGLEDRRVKLGCVMPGESAAVFGDALRRLASAATYLYQDGPRAWYATQPTVTKLADDRAEQLKRDPDNVAAELEARVPADLRKTGDFSRVHPLPQSGADVADDLDAPLGMPRRRLLLQYVARPHLRRPRGRQIAWLEYLVGTNDGSFPGPDDIQVIETIFAFGSQSVVLTQEVRFRQGAHNQLRAHAKAAASRHDHSPACRLMREARRWPRQAAPSQAAMETPMLAPASTRSPAAARRKVSRLNTEKVVKPPQMPVMTNCLWRVLA